MHNDTVLALCTEWRNAGLQQQQQPTQGGLPLAVPAVTAAASATPLLCVPSTCQTHHRIQAPAKPYGCLTPIKASWKLFALWASLHVCEVLFWLHPCHCHSCTFFLLLVLNIILPSFSFLSISFFCQRNVCKDRALDIHWVKPDVTCRIRRPLKAQSVFSCFPPP